MEPATLRPIKAVVLDSSVLIAAERRKWTAAMAIEDLRKSLGEVPIVLSAVTVVEVGERICQGIYRASLPEIRVRLRKYPDDLKATIPTYPFTESTAEIVARIGGEQAAPGINLPLGDVMIGAFSLELDYSIATANGRDFGCIPGLRMTVL